MGLNLLKHKTALCSFHVAHWVLCMHCKILTAEHKVLSLMFNINWISVCKANYKKTAWATLWIIFSQNTKVLSSLLYRSHCVCMYGHIFQHKNSAEYSQIKILKTRHYQKVHGCSGFCMVFFFVYLWTAIMSSHTQLIVSLNFASKELTNSQFQPLWKKNI